MMKRSDIENKWKQIKEKLWVEYEISKVSYETWIIPLNLGELKGNIVSIEVPSEFSNTISYINNKFRLPFKVTISEIMGEEVEVDFYLKGSPDEYTNNDINVDKYVDNSGKDGLFKKANLIEKYSFNTFVNGDNNRFAHSAALAVAENPGAIYNPLYIYGGSGLGKTHLMHSIGQFILEKDPTKNVIYVPSHIFTDEVIEGIRSGNAAKMANFREKYRSTDVFLIDDIQYIIGKEQTQVEFFNIFNVLQQANKQIVISSDKPPSKFEYLDERFLSRFKSGLVADIKAPDYETRMAILRKNVETLGKNIEDDVLIYIANNIRTNVRDLEGALLKLNAYMNLNSLKTLNMELALEALSDVIYPDGGKQISVNLIIEKVGEEFGINPDDIISKKRSAEMVTPRHVAMYLCREFTDLSLADIAKKLNKKDHSTVNHGVRKITDDMKKNGELSVKVNNIIQKISPGL